MTNESLLTSTPDVAQQNTLTVAEIPAADVSCLGPVSTGTPICKATTLSLAVLGALFAFTDDVMAAVTLDQLVQQVAAMQSQVTQLQSANRRLQNQLNQVRANSVLALGDKLSYDAASNAAIFSGLNVQIVNGETATATTNGFGNLIIGYNETDPNSMQVCEDGIYRGEEACRSAPARNGQNLSFGPNLRTGSHNIVVGRFHSFTRYGGLVAGEDNAITGEKASVLGGRRNHAGAEYAVISAGAENKIEGIYASVTGGSQHTAMGPYNSISGGNGSLTQDYYASVCGGSGNIASGQFASVTGGSGNVASGNNATVTGGSGNRALASFSSLSGGLNRYVDRSYFWRAGDIYSYLP